MPKVKLDYSEYQANTLERFRAVRSSNPDVLLNYFRNQISENADEKILMVAVTDFHEDDYMTEIYAKAENIELEAYKEKVQAAVDCEHERESATDNEVVINRYANRFAIDTSSSFGFERENKGTANNNAFSGTRIHIPLGEGILDFCYTDFMPLFQGFFQSIGLLYDDAALAVLSGQPSHIPQTEPIRNRNEEMVFQYGSYTETMVVLGDVIYASLYTAIFPPVLLSKSREAVTHYARFIIAVQSEMLDLLKFCFDLDYYPAVLGGLHPVERFAIYSRVNNRPSSFKRTENFTHSHKFSGVAMSLKMTSDELASRITKAFVVTEEHKAFQSQFGLSDAELEVYVRFPTFASVSYECDNLYDMLMLEFTKMLEQGVRFKKCKNCGKYFILKGNYKTDYCDRIPNEETQTCQTIASLRNYREKVSGNDAWRLYNKYYKRYHARMKAGNIPQDIFKQWQYRATAMRDDCGEEDEKIRAFDLWLHKSFPNGKRES